MQLRWYRTRFNPAAARPLLACVLCALLAACGSPAVQRQPQEQALPDHYRAYQQELVANAHLLLGTPYRYGGDRPTTGFDCSGFVQYAHKTVGIRLPRTSRQQHRASRPVSRNNIRPGDLLFFRIDTKRSISHVGIYIGKGRFIHAPSSGKRVSIARLDNPYWRKHFDSAGRIF